MHWTKLFPCEYSQQPDHCFDHVYQRILPCDESSDMANFARACFILAQKAAIISPLIYSWLLMRVSNIESVLSQPPSFHSRQEFLIVHKGIWASHLLLGLDSCRTPPQKRKIKWFRVLCPFPKDSFTQTGEEILMVTESISRDGDRHQCLLIQAAPLKTVLGRPRSTPQHEPMR